MQAERTPLTSPVLADGPCGDYDHPTRQLPQWAFRACLFTWMRMSIVLSSTLFDQLKCPVHETHTIDSNRTIFLFFFFFDCQFQRQNMNSNTDLLKQQINYSRFGQRCERSAHVRRDLKGKKKVYYVKYAYKSMYSMRLHIYMHCANTIKLLYACP